MKLRDHLDKGIWAVADKGLLLLYGFAVIVIVVTTIPDTEWGAFNLYQSIFLIICFIADSVFLQPMVKFASEHEAEIGDALGASFILYVGSLAVGGLLCFATTNFLADLFNSSELLELLPWLPILLIGHIFRNVGIRYLQALYHIKAIFWVDLAFFGSIIALCVVAHQYAMLNSALDFVKINLIGGVLSSIVAVIFSRKGLLEMPLLNVPKDEYKKLLSFAKYQAGTSVLQQLQQWSDNLIIGIYHTPKEVGLYAAAKTLYRLFDAVKEGATLLIVPIASRLHSTGDKEKLSTLVEQLLFLAFMVLVPVSLVLAFGSDTLMHIFYKDKFPGIDGVFQILILSGIVLPFYLVATNVLIGIGNVKGLFLSMLGGTLIFFAMNRILVPGMASVGAAIAVLFSIAAIGIFGFIAMRKELSISPRGIAASLKDIKSLLKRPDKKDRQAL
ncbi:MAG TPA: oligosaccharide flippase family protein [Candidatus Kapabacteria bacterium]